MPLVQHRFKHLVVGHLQRGALRVGTRIHHDTRVDSWQLLGCHLVKQGLESELISSLGVEHELLVLSLLDHVACKVDPEEDFALGFLPSDFFGPLEHLLHLRLEFSSCCFLSRLNGGHRHQFEQLGNLVEFGQLWCFQRELLVVRNADHEGKLLHIDHLIKLLVLQVVSGNFGLQLVGY